MENLGQLKKWLQGELENINLEMGLQGNYIVALISDDLNTKQGKIDLVSELLCCSLPSASSSELEALAVEIVENYDGMKEGKGKKKVESEGKKSAFDDLGNLSKHLKKEGEGEKKESKESAEERKKRQMLLMNYGYEEENIDSDDEDDDFVNDNAQRVKDAADAVRIENKQAHDAKVARDKANLAADKARKEEKKNARKTVKQERKRM